MRRTFLLAVPLLVSGSVQANPEATFTLPGGATMEMVWVEPGTFIMGSPEDELGRYNYEGPQHQVTITSGFYLGKYEITREQWEAIIGTRPWEGKDVWDWVRPDSDILEPWVWSTPDPRLPASHMSWYDAQMFVAKLNEAEGAEVYRLPTEAEWECACRAGTTTRWWWGEDGRKVVTLENVGPHHGRNAALGSHAKPLILIDKSLWPVGSFYPNPWGLYDMHGNVAEWCQDWWKGYYTGDPQVDPPGPDTGSKRVIRGGHCYSNGEDTRSAYRDRASPDQTRTELRNSGPVGFRVLRMTSDTPTSITPRSWREIKRQYRGE